MRGCSLFLFPPTMQTLVFPAGAGVFPDPCRHPAELFRVPRRCGGVPLAGLEFKAYSLCSPQVRGCSPHIIRTIHYLLVFPAGAGVFLGKLWCPVGIDSVPRRCGGVPAIPITKQNGYTCSPQVRGCSSRTQRKKQYASVFPAGAGVFLRTLHVVGDSCCVPRRCGGVPNK